MNCSCSTYRLLYVALLCCAMIPCSPRGLGDVPDFEADVLPILKSHCFACHGNGASEGNLVLDAFHSNAEAQQKPVVWWNVLKNVRAGVMPPPGEDRLTDEERDVLARWVKFGAFQTDPEDVDPGRAPVRRLNRAEYGNTVSDLMGIPFDASLLFPPDDSGFGFDNVGDALSFSPLLMEKYLRASQSIVDQAVPKFTWLAPSKKIEGSKFRDDDRNLNGSGLSGRDPAHVQTKLELEQGGKYSVRTRIRLHGSFEFDPSRYEVVLRIDGVEKTRNEYGWDENKLVKADFPETIEAGEHELSLELIPIPLTGDQKAPPDAWVRFEIEDVTLEGPEGALGKDHPPNYRRFFPEESPPTNPEQRRTYAFGVLQRFAKRAFRGPVANDTVERLVEIAVAAWKQPDATFESGVGQAMVAVLASPRFLFRMEAPSTAVPAGVRFADVSEYELASRLSYFLWSSMPDDELFRLADQNQLRVQVSSQIDRMLKDDRARDSFRNFVGQWLRTRDVMQVALDPIAVLGLQDEYEELRSRFRGRRPQPGVELPPEEQKARDRLRELRELSDRYGDELRRAMQKETELCFEHIARNNLSVLDLLSSDYTFVNETLASHYGLEPVKGKEMRRVSLPADSPRGGVLGHGSMLVVTSNPTRTSPVKRGLFVLENLLGTPSPPAPPDVPELGEAAKKFGDKQPSLRELLAAHRESALCASCHARMDPLGLALENFSALGTWRTEESGQPVDASGQLITGESFRDVRELKRILREQRSEDFYRCLTQKMMTFAIGRGLEYSDEHTIDLIVARLQGSNGQFRDLIEGIVMSAPFQKRRVNSQP